MIDLNHIGPRIILTFGNGHIYLTESVCLEIIVCAVIAALGIWMGSRLERVPRGKQVVAETIVSAVVLPVTLALRLFGNIFGGMIVVDLWLNFMGNLSMRFCSVPILRCVTGIPLNLFFDIFEPLIQAYIFTVLTAVNLNEALSGEMPETAEKRRRKRLARQEKRRLREEKQEA